MLELNSDLNNDNLHQHCTWLHGCDPDDDLSFQSAYRLSAKRHLRHTLYEHCIHVSYAICHPFVDTLTVSHQA